MEYVKWSYHNPSLSKTSVLGVRCLTPRRTNNRVPRFCHCLILRVWGFASKEAEGPTSPSSARICSSIYTLERGGHHDLMMVVAVTVRVLTHDSMLPHARHSSKHGTDSKSLPLPTTLWNRAGSVFILWVRKMLRNVKELNRVSKWGVWIWIQSWVCS